MIEIKLELDDANTGAFFLYEDGKRQGEMVSKLTDTHVIVYHTEVSPESEGKGFAKQLLEAMMTYAREQQLKVVPLCSYVHTQFKRHPELYADIWEKE